MTRTLRRSLKPGEGAEVGKQRRVSYHPHIVVVALPKAPVQSQPSNDNRVLASCFSSSARKLTKGTIAAPTTVVITSLAGYQGSLLEAWRSVR